MPIQQLVPIALKLDFSEQFSGGLTDSKFRITPLKGSIEDIEIISVFEFATEINSLENDFKLNATVRIPFIISDKKHIDNDDCFEIMKFGKAYLEQLVNKSIYPSEESKIIAEPSFDVLSALMNTFLLEMNDKGFYQH
jgi:hypothetical protein